MDSPFSDTCFEHVSRQKELLMLHQLRKQNSAVDDALFPYGLVLADLPPWEVQSIVHDQYTVGLDVERTVTYVSAALDYINRKSRRLGTDAWLFCVDRNLNQVSWSHELFVPYQYDQAVAEQRIGKILMVAKIEQSKIDANSIPWKNTCPDGTNLSGQLRWFPHRYEQHTDLLLNYNFLIVQNEYHLGDLCGGRYLRFPLNFIQIPTPQGPEGAAQITREVVLDYAIQSVLPGGSINRQNFPLSPIQISTPQDYQDYIQIIRKVVPDCII
ncbi:uncharacterized protein EAF01_011375 [Botrytis porri]|uniref:uncharacterized protein n=1 Tax=Botrytis porri TaxID=87229 RepID=UPI001901FA59|nr:uncharacterized protein EAF01_011375 [Botrytis porri]KAF7885310.1 hypothetical protein EAF01_011375 [Botrytis porri]